MKVDPNITKPGEGMSRHAKKRRKIAAISSELKALKEKLASTSIISDQDTSDAGSKQSKNRVLLKPSGLAK